MYDKGLMDILQQHQVFSTKLLRASCREPKACHHHQQKTRRYIIIWEPVKCSLWWLTDQKIPTHLRNSSLLTEASSTDLGALDSTCSWIGWTRMNIQPLINGLRYSGRFTNMAQSQAGTHGKPDLDSRESKHHQNISGYWSSGSALRNRH